MNIGYQILDWYNHNKRDLPWRYTKDAYLIWVSEIIMQQTRILQGLSYYQRFVNAFPDIATLASSAEDDVLLLWQGLGYYSRARNMHHTAKYILQELNGVFPDTFDEIVKLKGIGNYTAAAIASVCFNQVKPAIDGNVYRVFTRIFDIDAPVDKRAGQKQVEDLSRQEIVKENPGDYNQAMMDFGAVICTPKNPGCRVCPVSNQCMALKNNQVQNRPVKSMKQKIRKRYFHYLVVLHNNRVVIQKRETNDIWKNLFEFPLVEAENVLELKELMESIQVKMLQFDAHPEIVHYKKIKTHKLSHQHIYSQFLMIKVNELVLPKGCHEVAFEELSDYPFSKLILNYLNAACE